MLCLLTLEKKMPTTHEGDDNVPGRSRFIEFGNFQTSGISILVHSIIYFGLLAIFLLAVHVHMYIGY
ncbi:hypothetical protein B296_00057630 [Ensete ventricosum]|uniref:Uncharacterized protein n=1 Tax=Ensete ventricosum TaxID=4639 RepID=A0A426X102_ENSVE|nr:hypothetical protein B296_00057630 [Ensete ventricosum]